MAIATRQIKTPPKEIPYLWLRVLMAIALPITAFVTIAGVIGTYILYGEAEQAPGSRGGRERLRAFTSSVL
jgi:hypothetical protein